MDHVQIRPFLSFDMHYCFVISGLRRPCLLRSRQYQAGKFRLFG